MLNILIMSISWFFRNLSLVGFDYNYEHFFSFPFFKFFLGRITSLISLPFELCNLYYAGDLGSE